MHHDVDGHPAHHHVLAVESVLHQFAPEAPDWLRAAALLSQTPDCLPGELSTGASLAPFGAQVIDTVTCAHGIRSAMAGPIAPDPTWADVWTLHVVAADIAASLSMLRQRAHANTYAQATYFTQHREAAVFVADAWMIASAAIPNIAPGLAAHLSKQLARMPRPGEERLLTALGDYTVGHAPSIIDALQRDIQAGELEFSALNWGHRRPPGDDEDDERDQVVNHGPGLLAVTQSMMTLAMRIARDHDQPETRILLKDMWKLVRPAGDSITLAPRRVAAGDGRALLAEMIAWESNSSRSMLDVAELLACPRYAAVPGVLRNLIASDEIVPFWVEADDAFDPAEDTPGLIRRSITPALRRWWAAAFPNEAYPDTPESLATLPIIGAGATCRIQNETDALHRIETIIATLVPHIPTWDAHMIMRDNHAGEHQFAVAGLTISLRQYTIPITHVERDELREIHRILQIPMIDLDALDVRDPVPAQRRPLPVPAGEFAPRAWALVDSITDRFPIELLAEVVPLLEAGEPRMAMEQVVHLAKQHGIEHTSRELDEIAALNGTPSTPEGEPATP